MISWFRRGWRSVKFGEHYATWARVRQAFGPAWTLEVDEMPQHSTDASYAILRAPDGHKEAALHWCPRFGLRATYRYQGRLQDSAWKNGRLVDGLLSLQWMLVENHTARATKAHAEAKA